MRDDQKRPPYRHGTLLEDIRKKQQLCGSFPAASLSRRGHGGESARKTKGHVQIRRPGLRTAIVDSLTVGWEKIRNFQTRTKGRCICAFRLSARVMWNVYLLVLVFITDSDCGVVPFRNSGAYVRVVTVTILN